jgi:hypothetical protein
MFHEAASPLQGLAAFFYLAHDLAAPNLKK